MFDTVQSLDGRGSTLASRSSLPPGDEQTRTLVATNELRERRHKYKAAYTSYMHSVHALSDASQNGLWPTAEVLRLEAESLQELISLRQSLLDALYAHAMKAARVSPVFSGGRRTRPERGRQRIAERAR